MTTTSAAPSTDGGTLTFDVAAWAASTARPGDWFDTLAADHAANFFPRFLRHTKGKWARQPFELIPWQLALVRTIFGWKRADGLRRFRIVYVEVPRKNGKTGLAAGIALYLAFAAGESGAEVYCAANDTGQAEICFNEAKRMRSSCPWLCDHTDAWKHNISAQEGWSKLEVLSANVGTKDGLNPSAFVFDEVHASKTRDLYDVLDTATGAREQPLELLITTAGSETISLCGELHEHAERVRDGDADDHEFLPVIFAAGADDDIADPATWAKANPSLGYTIVPEYIAKKLKRARDMPSGMPAFKRLHLNIWTAVERPWIRPEQWVKCNAGAASVTLDALAGRDCYAGLDLSTTTDLTALALLFPPQGGARWDLWVHFWLPRDGIAERVKQDRVPYTLWEEQGFVTLTPGNVVDYDAIRALITGKGEHGSPEAEAASLRRRFRIRELVRDRWNAAHLTTQLMADGLTVVDLGQNFAGMSAPCKEFERLIAAGDLNHGGNPVLDWMAGIVSIKDDGADNIKPVKPDRRKNSKRIDGIVASVMALARAMTASKPPTSPYNIRGLRTLGPDQKASA